MGLYQDLNYSQFSSTVAFYSLGEKDYLSSMCCKGPAFFPVAPQTEGGPLLSNVAVHWLQYVFQILFWL